MWRALVFCMMLMLGLASASADTWDARNQECIQRDNVDRGIRACTEIITEGSETSNKLALAYSYRCRAYRDAGDNLLDKALADCNKAVELDPKCAAPYVNRGGFTA